MKRVLQIIRILFILPGFNWDDDKLKMDIKRWIKILGLQEQEWVAVAIILWECPEFRNILIYRNRFRKIYKTWISYIYKPLNTLFIQTKEIGGGLFIQHGFSTMISAESIGENAWINQQVTIGYNGHGKAPVIGNNVMITCGAKVLGEIVVGDNAIIGANAVVIHNVEEGTTVGGIPAKRIK